MIEDYFQEAPTFERSLDLWKIGVEIVLLAVVLFGAVNWLNLAPSAADEPITDSPRILPLTLARLAPNQVTDSLISTLTGTATAWRYVIVSARYIPPHMAETGARSQQLELGTAQANELGQWRLPLADALVPGQYMVQLQQSDDETRGDAFPTVFTVTEPGEERSVDLTPPTIFLPAVAARMPHGETLFAGTARRGARVRVYVNNRVLGEDIADRHRQWMIASERTLLPGTYEARAVTLTPAGDLSAESASVAFSVEPADSADEVGTSVDEIVESAIPALPLQIGVCPVASSANSATTLAGLATPHSGVGLWLEEEPVHFVNAGINGCWGVELTSFLLAQRRDLVVRTELGEVLTLGGSTR